MNDLIEKDYISLTDIMHAKNLYKPFQLTQQWMKDKKTIIYLADWEKSHNPNFNLEGYNQYIKPPTKTEFTGLGKWMKLTNAIGLKRTRGRYGKIWAHKDIAAKFIDWLNSVDSQ